MRNNYVGDIGDYFKYGLLRHLCQDIFKLGIIWYHFPDHEDNGHGSKTTYLEDPQNAVFDSELFAKLNEIVNIKQDRTIKAIEGSGIFQKSTLYFNQPLSFLDFPRPLSRRRQRREWFNQALSAIDASDVVFLDPDTGLECTSKRTHEHIEGPKYVSYDEVERLLEAKKSVVIYQHVRQIKPSNLLENRTAEIQEATGYKGEVLSVCLKANNESDSRLFLIIPTQEHAIKLQERFKAYKASAWERFIQ